MASNIFEEFVAFSKKYLPGFRPFVTALKVDAKLLGDMLTNYEEQLRTFCTAFNRDKIARYERVYVPHLRWVQKQVLRLL